MKTERNTTLEMTERVDVVLREDVKVSQEKEVKPGKSSKEKVHRGYFNWLKYRM
jgi:putative transposon-encoded protein